METRFFRAIPVLLIALVISSPGLLPAAIDEESATTGVPDLRIVGWTIDDTLAGNGDGGLHPGETALIEIHLMNFGNETARSVAGTLNEVTDHPDVEILDKVAAWPDLAGTGAPGSSLTPHFRIQVATTRPCHWEIPLRLDLVAQGGYFQSLDFTLRMVDPQSSDLRQGDARPFYYGAEAQDRLGNTTATGDIDGDGFEDLIVGIFNADGTGNLRPQSGEVAVFYGGPSHRTDTDLAGASPPDSFLVLGADSGDELGSSVAAGDVNGDGFDDMILGASESQGFANSHTATTGEVAVIFGRATRFTADIDLATSPLGEAFFVYGADNDDRYGWSVAAGDINADGFDDILVGAISADGPANAGSSNGEVAIVYGDPAILFSIDLGTPPSNVAFVYGPDIGDAYGRSVASGDVDGDGFDDLLTGTSAANGPGNSRSFAGEVAIVYGDPVQLPDIDFAAPPVNSSTIIYGRNAAYSCGLKIGAADIDGDGFAETFVGCPNGDGPAEARNDAGEVAIVYGSATRSASIDLGIPSQEVRFVFGVDADDKTGGSLTSGDLDGDGYNELIVGIGSGDGPGNARFNSGETAVLFGGPDRLPDLDLASPPPRVKTIFGRDDEDGLAPTATGDLDGDGHDELILVSGGDGPGNLRPNAGEVAVLPGQARSRFRHDADPFAFIDATIGTDLGLGCDDCSSTIPIGFEFDYFGRKYTNVTVGSNGYLTFGGNGDLPLPFCPPNSATPNNTVAVLWDDWNPSAGGAVYSLLEGMAPNRRLTIEWAGVPLFPSTGDATFEVTLFETSDQILMQYQDTVVGDVFSDNGATAVTGLENGPGINGVPTSCFSPNVANSSAVRYRQFGNPTTVYSEDVESGAGAWVATGLWHIETEPSPCTPASRSGNSSWYYALAGFCDYDAFPFSGTLTSPTILALPQDAELNFWSRRQTENSQVADLSFVQAQGNGGGFATVQQVLDETASWRFTDDILSADPLNGTFAALDLTAYTGQDLDVRFEFDAVDGTANFFLGWMIDDIEINACPVFGAGGGAAAAEARATAQPDAICETAPGMVDAVGSYCAACTAPLTYQWREEGVPIGGATGIGYSIPAGHAPGMFDYTVEIGCPTSSACLDESDPAEVSVVLAPVEVGPTLMVGYDGGGTNLQFNWTDTAGASDYLVYSSADPSVVFTTEVGSASTGAGGLTAADPSEPLIFFRVAGRNPVCGVGPQNSP